MKFCSNCGNQIDDNAVICVKCGCAVQQQPQQPMQGYVEDKVSVGLVILAILIPLFGMIYWPVKHRECPNRARACGIAGIVAWVIYLVISLSIV